MSEPIQRRSRHRLVGESNQDALARLAGERDAALRDNERRRAELPPAGLPPVLATVEDVGRVCEAAGLMTPAGITTETTRTWATADGGVQFRAWFEADSFYCVSPLHTFGLDMFRGTPSAVLWHAIQACLAASRSADDAAGPTGAAELVGESWSEVRLRGQPGAGSSPYDFVFRSDRDHWRYLPDFLGRITAKWTDVRVEHRTVKRETWTTEWRPGAGGAQT